MKKKIIVWMCVSMTVFQWIHANGGLDRSTESFALSDEYLLSRSNPFPSHDMKYFIEEPRDQFQEIGTYALQADNGPGSIINPDNEVPLGNGGMVIILLAVAYMARIGWSYFISGKKRPL